MSTSSESWNLHAVSTLLEILGLAPAAYCPRCNALYVSTLLEILDYLRYAERSWATVVSTLLEILAHQRCAYTYLRAVDFVSTLLEILG